MVVGWVHCWWGLVRVWLRFGGFVGVAMSLWMFWWWLVGWLVWWLVVRVFFTG